MNSKTGPKDFFLNIGAIMTLYISVWSFLALWFALIDEIFKDPLAYFDPYRSGISLAVAALIVVFPTFLVISWVVHNNEKREPEKRELRVRKWLVFFTAFLAGMIIVADLVTLLYKFLSGMEITAVFTWKVVAVFVVVGAVLVYYIFKIRRDMTDNTAKYLTAIMSLIVIASIVMSFIVIGSPRAQRQKRFDQERTVELSSIQSQIINYWRQKGELPGTLSDIDDPLSGYTTPVDPDTGMEYEYSVVGDLSFELCATFNLVSEGSNYSVRYAEIPPYGKGVDESWAHGSGRVCFERVIDPELYLLRQPL